MISSAHPTLLDWSGTAQKKPFRLPTDKIRTGALDKLPIVLKIKAPNWWRRDLFRRWIFRFFFSGFSSRFYQVSGQRQLIEFKGLFCVLPDRRGSRWETPRALRAWRRRRHSEPEKFAGLFALRDARRSRAPCRRGALRGVRNPATYNPLSTKIL